ncbi:MAG: CheR family methyltransferase [Acidiferrobacterales bacterium]
MTSEDYDGFRAFLEDACGIVLGDNKHYLVSSRLSPLLAESGLPSLRDLLLRLKIGTDSRLRDRVIDAMTTNETSWFRDGTVFDLLKTAIIPDLAKLRSTRLRVWSAGCSSGQEPYSISMALQEFVNQNPGKLSAEAQIVATDISPSMLRQAESGIYDAAAMARGLTPERRSRFFIARGVQWEITREARQRVSFRALNLRQNFQALGQFDLIFCRNVLIYFSSELKRDILARIASLLRPGGYLVLGSAESLANYSDAFDMLRFPEGIVYRTKRKPVRTQHHHA